MESESAPETHRFCLPSGTVVEDWRVLGCHGHGAYGIVSPSPEPQVGEDGTWHMQDAKVRPPHELNPQVEPVLSALTFRMLSMAPEARGTAGELAETLEAAAGCAGPVEEPPSPVEESAVVSVPPRIYEEQRAPEKGRTLARLREWRPWYAVAIASAVLLVWAWRVVHVRPDGAATKERVASGETRPDAGTTDLGDEVSATPLASVHPPTGQEAIAQDTPPEPYPGQLRTDAKGRCPGPEQVPINGGCWLESRTKDAEACARSGHVFFKDRCYGPAMAPRRKPQPTSNPAHPQ